MLAATLAVGSVPAIALVQASTGAAGTPIAMAAEAGYDLDGKSYAAGVTWEGSADLGGMASIAQNMLTNYFGNQVQVSQNEDGSFNVVISFVKYSDAIQQIEYNGQSIQQSSDQTYTLVVSSLDEPIAAKLYIGGAMAVMFPNGVGFTMTVDTSGLPEAEPEPPAATVDKTALNEAIDAAKAIEQGKKSDEAWKALQDAIATAEKAAVVESAPQAMIDAVLAQLNAAVETFNASDDVADPTPGEEGQDPDPEPTPDPDPDPAPDPEPEPDEDAVETPGGFLLVPQQAYEVSVSLIKDDGSASMAAGYFEKTGAIVWNGESYLVDFSVTAEGQGFIQSIEGIESLGGGAYRATVDSLTDPVTLTFDLQVPGYGSMTQIAYLQIDTSSLPTKSGEPIDPADPQPSDPGTTGGNGNTSTGDQNNQQEAAVKFQKGHTYQVPIDFLKHNSSEVSMADQYFGDTALVRVSDDGTMLNVSFAATADGMTHIISLAYQGATLSPSGTQFTVSIPYTESNVVLPISMTIKEMQELGGPAQTADLHLYLTQAKDLGTNAGSLSASSSRMMADTGDDVSPIAAIAGGVAVVAAAAAASVAGSQMRRRLTHKE